MDGSRGLLLYKAVLTLAEAKLVLLAAHSLCRHSQRFHHLCSRWGVLSRPPPEVTGR